MDGLGFAAAPQKSVRALEAISVTVGSSSQFVAAPPYLLAELYPSGSPPGNYPGLPFIHMSPALTLLFGNPNTIIGPVLLPSGGLTFQFVIPAGLVGATLRIQALALSPAAANGIVASSNAHDFRML